MSSVGTREELCCSQEFTLCGTHAADESETPVHPEFVTGPLESESPCLSICFYHHEDETTCIAEERFCFILLPSSPITTHHTFFAFLPLRFQSVK